MFYAQSTAKGHIITNQNVFLPQVKNMIHASFLQGKQPEFLLLHYTGTRKLSNVIKSRGWGGGGGGLHRDHKQ